ncbi:MAG TPA: NADH-quinone oxidoreductase subunit NuoF [Ktedonobacterales bacterium]|nr:NADH-quinone oxidoreductase subunit NuoF [Ktedonobacterales bacterium]HEX5569919.1 NADH-quinone oxidoreductase subunit NuoF [Ktedonobacterales bacterium]
MANSDATQSTGATLPLGPNPRFVTDHFDTPDIDQIGVYRAYGGYEALAKALTSFQPDELVEEVKKSGLRGRGGAGFGTGMKWGFLPKESPKPRYLCVNGDESEPGTFKDRMIMEVSPHLLVEGVIIASYATKVHHAFIYVRGELLKAGLQVERAVREAAEAGFVGKNILGSGFDLSITVHHGAGAYICGEESALLESLEGKRGYPRLKPPFPAVVGLYGGPTVINNVETIATLPAIARYGADVYAAYGTEKSKGTRVFCLSGHVNRPGNYEAPLGVPLRTLVEDYGGGVRGGRQIKGIIPGGSSTPILGADKLDLPMDYESVAAAGSMLGSGGVIVLDDQTCIVAATLRMSEFYRDESCGKCTPCREGTFWLVQLLERLEAGEGKESDIELLLDICDNMFGKVFCPLGDAATMPIVSSIKLFRDEYIYHVREHACLVGPGARRALATAHAG